MRKRHASQYANFGSLRTTSSMNKTIAPHQAVYRNLINIR